jgi:hypothetical protein
MPVDEEPSKQGSKASRVGSRAFIVAIMAGLGVGIAVLGYIRLGGLDQSMRAVLATSATEQRSGEPSNQSARSTKSEIQLRRESVELLLEAFDQAMRQKDVNGVLQHIAPDAAIIIHMRQGVNQQTALLTREEYGNTLAMGFAFPSANDFTRLNTSVSIAPDGRSAKVSFKSTETLRQATREFTIEGEATLLVKVRDDKPMILSLEQIVPGDST